MPVPQTDTVDAPDPGQAPDPAHAPDTVNTPDPGHAPEPAQEPESVQAITFEQGLDLLQAGKVTIQGQIPWSSNSTFFVSVVDGRRSANAVYKPRRGERPLWDFASGTLCNREAAAFVVSESIGWRLVPPTVLRDGPLGPGALQLFIPHDPADHYLALQEPDLHAVMRIVAFDAVINNADRKAGHVLHAGDGTLWAIDHGVSFHVDAKMRSVIWDFAGQPVPADIVNDLATFEDILEDIGAPVRAKLLELLAGDEIDAMGARVAALLRARRFPVPDDDRWSIPWPPV